MPCGSRQERASTSTATPLQIDKTSGYWLAQALERSSADPIVRNAPWGCRAWWGDPVHVDSAKSMLDEAVFYRVVVAPLSLLALIRKAGETNSIRRLLIVVLLTLTR